MGHLSDQDSGPLMELPLAIGSDLCPWQVVMMVFSGLAQYY